MEWLVTLLNADDQDCISSFVNEPILTEEMFQLNNMFFFS